MIRDWSLLNETHDSWISIFLVQILLVNYPLHELLILRNDHRMYTLFMQIVICSHLAKENNVYDCRFRVALYFDMLQSKTMGINIWICRTINSLRVRQIFTMIQLFQSLFIINSWWIIDHGWESWGDINMVQNKWDTWFHVASLTLIHQIICGMGIISAYYSE